MRGFIGPLGDDFPAIFPIALGLMFFFGAIALAYDTYDYKETQATLMRSNIMISRSVRANILMTPEYWVDEACPLITEIQANYGVGSAMMLTRPNYAEEPGLSDALPPIEVGNDVPFVFLDGEPAWCPAIGDSVKEWTDGNGIPVDDPSRHALALSYPVLVNMYYDGNSYVACDPSAQVCEQKTANLVVYTWR